MARCDVGGEEMVGVARCDGVGRRWWVWQGVMGWGGDGGCGGDDGRG